MPEAVEPSETVLADSADTAPANNEDKGEAASMFAKIAAYAKSKTGEANSLAGLQKKVATLTAQVKERDDKLAALQAKADEQTELLASFAEWLEANGHCTAQEAAAEPAKAFEKAVGAGVANTVRKIGIPAAVVTVATAGSAIDAEALESLIEKMNASTDPGERGKLAAKVASTRKQLANQTSN